MDHIALGQRLRAVREKRGLSQQAAADEVGLPRTAVTLIESGQRQVSTIELTKFATVYRWSVAELVSPNEAAEEDYLVVLHRLAPELRDDPNVKIDVETCLDLCRLGVDLESVLGRNQRQGPPKFDIAPPRSAADAISQGTEVAEEERRRLGLGFAPIRNISACINEQGVWALTCKLRSDMSGLFMRHHAIGLAVVANASHKAPRKRFSFAHEYGHALMDRDREVQITNMANASDLIEKRANAFAAAFLLPAKGVEQFLNGLGKGRGGRQQQLVYDVASNGRFEAESRAPANSQEITYQDVASLAMTYGASYDATAYRLNSLHYVSRAETQDLLTKSALGKRSAELLLVARGGSASGANEEDDVEIELRGQILRLALEAYRREEISRGRLLEISKSLDIAGNDIIALVDAERAAS